MLTREVLQNTGVKLPEQVDTHTRAAHEFIRAAQVRDGHAATWIQEGVEMRVSKDTPVDREILAGHMGIVYSVSRGGEKTQDMIDFDLLSKLAMIPADRLREVAGVMDKVGLLKSSINKIVKKRRA